MTNISYLEDDQEFTAWQTKVKWAWMVATSKFSSGKKCSYVIGVAGMEDSTDARK